MKAKLRLQRGRITNMRTSNSGGIYMRVASLLLTASTLDGCSLGDDPDWLEAEARSPDGRLIARLWCENFCDITEKATLTVSPADTSIGLRRMHQEGLEGQLPERDRAVSVYELDPAVNGSNQWRLEWRTPQLLVIAGRCLSADGAAGPPAPRRFRDVTILFADVSSTHCERAPPA